MTRCRALSAVAVLCLAAAGAVQASPARLAALGGGGAWIEDAAGARAWYGAVVDYGSFAGVASGPFTLPEGYPRNEGRGRPAGPSAGAQVALGDSARIGTVGLWWDARAADGGIGELVDDGLQGAWQVMYARAFGGLAAGFSLRHAKLENTAGGALSIDRFRDDFGLGLRTGLGDRAFLDVAGELVRLEDRTGIGAPAEESRSTADSWGLRARASIEAAPGVVLVPTVAHRREHRTWDETGAADERTTRLWRLGAGLVWLPDPDRMVAASAEWRQRRDRREGPLGGDLGGGAEVLDLRLAAEARVHVLVTVRAAVGFRHVATTLEGVEVSAIGTVPVSAGLALHLGPADLEASVANFAPAGPDGRPRVDDDDAAWLHAGLTWWF